MAWAPDYADGPALKAYLRIDDDVDNDQLFVAAAAASRAVDRHTNRQFGLVSAPEERLYTARWDKGRCRWVVDIDDLMTVTGLVITVDGVAVDEYSLQPSNAAVKGGPWTRVVVEPESAILPTAAEDGVTVVARWGWTAVPTAVSQAVLLQASRLFTRRNAPFGVAGSPDSGSEMRLLAKVDPDVAVALGPYIRWWSAA